MPVVTVADPAPIDIASLGSPRGEEKDPASEPSKRARGRTLEIRIKLAPDEDGVLKLHSATEVHKNAPHSLGRRELAPPAPSGEKALAPIAETTAGGLHFRVSPILLLAALMMGFAVRAQCLRLRSDAPPPQQTKVSTKALADRIVLGESQGDPGAKNRRSSAAGPAQFVDGTWLELVKRRRPDIAAGLNQKQILQLRGDPQLARFMTERYVEQNASLLSRQGLQATPGSLYLAHFAGPGGAAAILTAPENADAANVIANADRRPGVTREKILSGNPFMKHFTAKDLKDWAELKMQSLNLSAAAAEQKGAASDD